MFMVKTKRPPLYMPSCGVMMISDAMMLFGSGNLSSTPFSWSMLVMSVCLLLVVMCSHSCWWANHRSNRVRRFKAVPQTCLGADLCCCLSSGRRSRSRGCCCCGLCGRPGSSLLLRLHLLQPHHLVAVSFSAARVRSLTHTQSTELVVCRNPRVCGEIA